MATPIGFDPSVYNSSSNTEGFTLGQTYDYNGRLFRFVQNSTDAALANGAVAVWASLTNYVVTGASRATAIGGVAPNAPAGVAVGAVSISNYGFILVKGLHTAVISTATTALVPQMASATADTCTDVAAATDNPFGVSLTATAAGICTVQVDI